MIYTKPHYQNLHNHNCPYCNEGLHKYNKFYYKCFNCRKFQAHYTKVQKLKDQYHPRYADMQKEHKEALAREERLLKQIETTSSELLSHQ